MAWYHELRAAARALVRRRQDERELDEEVRFHLDMEARALERAGLHPEEARRQALRAFGGVDRYKEEVRDERGTRSLEDLAQDARFAWRALRRRPGLTAVATLTLALGIGATTALFGVVKSVLLTPLPWRDPGSIAMVWSAWKGFDQTWLSYDEWEAYRADVKAFADIAIFNDGATTLAGGTGEPERVRGGSVSVAAPSCQSAMSWNAGTSAFHASHSSHDSHVWSKPFHALHTTAIDSGRPKGSGASSTDFTTPKSTVVAPMPSARVSSTTAVKPGARRMDRKANRTSCVRAPHESARCTSRSISRSISRQAAATRS